MGLRVLTRPQPCVLQRHQGVVGLIECNANWSICNERHHRIFTGMTMMSGPDGRWLIEDGQHWWYNAFSPESGVTVITSGNTEADELETCTANTASPMLPLSSEGAHKVAKELIAHYRVNNQEARSNSFSRMEFCPTCNKLKSLETERLTTEELRQSSAIFLPPQYGHPVTWMMGSMGGLCKTQH